MTSTNNAPMNAATFPIAWKVYVAEEWGAAEREVCENPTMEKMWVDVFKGKQSSHFEVVSYTVHADGLLELNAPDGSVRSFQVGEYTKFEARQ